MSRRDEAVEAMAEAMDTAYNPDRYPIMAAMFRDYADAGLDAALAVLQPAVPNEVEALEALPVGTVLRGHYAIERDPSGWRALTLDGKPRTTARTVDVSLAIGVTEWQVLYRPEEER